MLSQVQVLKAETDRRIEWMKGRTLSRVDADHVLLESVRRDALPASQLPRVLAAYDEPRYADFAPRTAWSLFNAITEVLKTHSPRQQMEDSLRLVAVFQKAVPE